MSTVHIPLMFPFLYLYCVFRLVFCQPSFPSFFEVPSLHYFFLPIFIHSTVQSFVPSLLPSFLPFSFLPFFLHPSFLPLSPVISSYFFRPYFSLSIFHIHVTGQCLFQTQLTFPNMSIDNAARLCQGTTSTTSCTELSGCVAHASVQPANWPLNTSWATCSTMATRELASNTEVWLESDSTEHNPCG